MKIKFSALIIIIFLVLFTSCTDEKGINPKLYGIWEHELYGSITVIEFRENGEFIDHTFDAVNRFKGDNKTLTVYVDGADNSEIEIAYSFESENLLFGNVLYKKSTKGNAE